MQSAPDIRFPGLGIEIEHLGSGITLPIGNGFEVKFYGMIIGLGIMLGYTLACFCAKREKDKMITSDHITDFLIYGLLFGVAGARLYYVAFEWDQYKDNLLQIFNIRGGGLAIYGGVIGSFATAAIYCKIKKLSALQLLDVCVPGLALGQAIGRWGNFCNREAFGGYCDNLFAMQIPVDDVYSQSYITQDMMDHMITVNGTRYISVHPTFLYECMWNLVVVLILVFVVQTFKKYNGQMTLAYLGLYGLGRLWIEGLRTDQLIIGNTGMPVSQVLSIGLVVFAFAMNLILVRRGRSVITVFNRTEVCVTNNLETYGRVASVLGDNKIDYVVKTVNMNPRGARTGSLGTDPGLSKMYHVYVNKKDEAEALHRINQK